MPPGWKAQCPSTGAEKSAKVKGGLGNREGCDTLGGEVLPLLSERQALKPSPSYSVFGPRTPAPIRLGPQLQGKEGDIEGTRKPCTPSAPKEATPHLQCCELSGCISMPRPPWGTDHHPSASTGHWQG